MTAFGEADAARFDAHYESARGRVRTELVHRQLLEHLPTPPAALLDVGGGAGRQSLPLALGGYDVTLLDPSPAMLARAAAAVEALPREAAARVSLVEGPGEDAVALLGAGRFDAVLCHGVLMYLAEPAPMVDAIADLVRPGGVVSVVATNQAALADRPARNGDWQQALSLFDADHYVNGLGITARADSPESVAALFAARGVAELAWYGVRVFTDAWGRSGGPGDGEPLLFEVEWQACRRDPYRRISRLFHWVGRRTPADDR